MLGRRHADADRDRQVGLFPEGGDQRELSFKRVDLYTIDETARRNMNGQINVTTRRIQLSPDGKTMTIKSSGTGADRQDDIRVYDKRNPEAQ